MFKYYMKLQFTSKLDIIRTKRRIRRESQQIEFINKGSSNNQTIIHDSVNNKSEIQSHPEDAKILLRKLHFINNPSLQQPIVEKTRQHSPITIEKNTTGENITIVIEEINHCAKNKFYE